jgi:TolB-like protein/class 3 adenylate cyclase
MSNAMTDSATHTVRRRLGAVLFADVVGYTRLMGENEDGTYWVLKEILAKLDASCRKFDGRVIEVRGDGVLALFDSATDAVRFAVEAQKEIEEAATATSDGDAIRFRIGIHLGDILTDERGIHGDSVNIAARLESIADPGGIMISGAVYEQTRNRLPFGYEFIGPQSLKNVAEPVPAYRVRSEIKGVIMAPSLRLQKGAAGRDRPEVPSVAVLPFQAAGGEESDTWFADGITEDITLNLSKFKNIFVIARGSAFFYKTRTVPPQQAARDLGVRYVAHGNIRRAGGRIRVSVELIDIDSERTIWGERYDRDLDDIFAIQDEITETIAAAAAVVVEASERQRMSQLAPSSLAAYGYVLRGQQHIYKYTRRDNHEAHEFYEKALKADRRYARASAALSRTLNVDWRYSWSDDPDSLLDTALEYAQNAIELDPTDARGFGELGFVHLYRKEHDAAISAYRRAMSLNPNDADLMSDYADALAHSGSNEEAIALLERAMRLNPYYPDQYLWHLGGAYFNLKDYDKVVESVLKMNNPTEGQRMLAAAYAQLGKMDHAREIAAKHREAHPNFSLARWSTVLPDRLEEDTQHFVEGLRKAGF